MCKYECSIDKGEWKPVSKINAGVLKEVPINDDLLNKSFNRVNDDLWSYTCKDYPNSIIEIRHIKGVIGW